MITGLDSLPESDPTNILRYRDGIYAVDLLTASITEFQFFDYLAENPGKLESICAHFGWDSRPADVLVTLMKSNGFVQEDEKGVLTNTANATEHLCSGSPRNLSEYYDSLREPYSIAAIFKRVAFASFFLAAFAFSGCESVSDSGGTEYSAGPQMTPVEGASMMQDRLGQIARSQIR